MTIPTSYTNDNDNLATVAWEETNGQVLNFLTKSAEVLIPELAKRGRVMAVPDVEIRSQPFYYDSPGDDTFTAVVPNTYGTGASTGQTSKEFASKLHWSTVEWQNNVTWPTTEVDGRGPLYLHVLRATSKMKQILNREEALLTRGATTINGTLAWNAPYRGDTDFDSTNQHPMSLLSLYGSGTSTHGDVADINASDETFAGVAGADAAEWLPTKTATAAANGSELLADFLSATTATYYGERQPDYGLTSVEVWKKVAALMRAEAALPQPVGANIVHKPNQTIMVGSIPLTWSRFLADKSVKWDFAAGTTSCYPILLLDLGSLRMDIPVSGSEVDGLNFVRRISNTQVREIQTQSFYRIAAKRGYSLDGGRRSFGAIQGVSLV